MTENIESQTVAAENEFLEGWKSGPRRTRWTKLPPQVGDPAPDFLLPDSTGTNHQISEFWNTKPLLLIFWRHYGCGCGMDRARRLREEYDGYVKSNANIALVGQGEPARAAAYSQKHELPPVPILCDPAYQVYESYGLLEGKESQIFFDAPDEFQDRQLEAGLKLISQRRSDGRPLVDNGWLLPGEFVIDTNGMIRLAYRYNYCEDFPDSRVLLAAIREANLKP